MSPQAFNQYVGLEFAERGRGPEAYDCWGLLAHVYRCELGITLPSFSEQYVTTEDSNHIASLIKANRPNDWIQIPEGSEAIGDGILLSLAGYPRHVGIVAGFKQILHIERATGSIIEPYSSPRIKRRILGFFRHKERKALEDFSYDHSSESKGIIS